MADMRTDVATLQRRLDELQRRQRVLLGAGLLMLAVLVLVATAAAQQPVQQPVRTSELLLTLPGTETVVARLGASTGRVALEFYDGTGRARVVFGLTGQGPTLETVDATGRLREFLRPGVHPLTR